MSRGTKRACRGTRRLLLLGAVSREPSRLRSLRQGTQGTNARHKQPQSQRCAAFSVVAVISEDVSQCRGTNWLPHPPSPAKMFAPIAHVRQARASPEERVVLHAHLPQPFGSSVIWELESNRAFKLLKL